MATVSEFFRTKPVKGDLGIEIEVEGQNLPPDEEFTPEWRATNDSSLRGESREYVFAKPLTLVQSQLALAKMQKVFLANKTTLIPSIRTGVHVHINVNDLTINQLFAFAATYYVFEELVTRWCGPGRQGNLFALRLVDAYEVIQNLISFLQSQRAGYLSTNDIRYAACNYCSLHKFGSLEFRQMGTPTDLSKVYRWATLLHTLKTSSVKYFERPANVVMDVSGYGYEAFVRRILPDDLADEFVFSQPDFAACMRRGMRLVQDWAFECPPEDVFQVAKPKPLRKFIFDTPAAPQPVDWSTIDLPDEPMESDDNEL